MVALDPSKIRDITPEALQSPGRPKILPASYWATTTPHERALFCHTHGIYGLPTVELVAFLKTLIGGKKAIEIGAGHGGLAYELNIPATDNRMQEMDRYRFIYAATGQPPVTYGDHVRSLHASASVRHFKPQVVIGSWVTHKYDKARHFAGGNEIGVDEEDILANCASYVVIGNEKTHQFKKIWGRKHTIEFPDWLYSRSVNGSRDFIAVFKGLRKP